MIRRSLRLAIVLAICFGVASPQALATSPVSKSGAPGRADLFVVQGWWTDHGSTLQVNGPEVYRTRGGRNRWRAARGTQRICVSYDVYKFEGAYYEEPWGHYVGDRQCGTAPRGYSLTFNAVPFGVTGYNSYNVEITATWRRARDGKFIGSRVWDYDSIEDYQCMTFKCEARYGFNNVASIFFEGAI